MSYVLTAESFSLCVLFCRSLACAAMLMYDYPLKTDMESVRNMHISCTNMFFSAMRTYAQSPTHTFTPACYVSRQTGSHIPALPGQTGCSTVDICIQ